MYESDAKDATSLYVTCLDEDPQKNDLIGDCVINMVRVMDYGEQDDWFQLSYKGREAGELLLQLTYYSHVSSNLSLPFFYLLLSVSFSHLSYHSLELIFPSHDSPLNSSLQ
ncbi:MAG: hypothetical protein JOS17DRAFT_9982 [Linnemannia elongata]|nr:MAG: hypothetical protein JOS17DRAFT_9982 [Linnemannia elongata]